MRLHAQDGRWYVGEPSPTERAWYGHGLLLTTVGWEVLDPQALRELAAEPENAGVRDAVHAYLAALPTPTSWSAHDTRTWPAPAGLAYLPYQQAGITHLVTHPVTLLADEMGLGKTVQVIGAINALPTLGKVLIIAPLTVKANWVAELARWLIVPRPVHVVGTRYPEWVEVGDIVLVHPDVLVKHAAALRAERWDLIVVDESHLFKNPEAQRSQVLLGGRWTGTAYQAPLQAARRWALTGTPIPNRPKELWPILHWLDPGTWRSAWDFYTRYCDAHEERFGWVLTGSSNEEELFQRLREGLMLRRLKAQVLTQLPPKLYDTHHVSTEALTAVERAALADEQRVLAACQRELAQVVREAEREVGNGEDRAAALGAHPVVQAALARVGQELTHVRHLTALLKVPHVLTRVGELLSVEPKVVVWAHHRDVAQALYAGCAAYDPVLLTGQSPPSARAAAVTRFQTDPSCRVFVGSLHAAGVGLTLTAASHAVFAEFDWVPGVMLQAEDRCHRLGQQGTVWVHHVVLQGSLDAHWLDGLAYKRAVAGAVLDGLGLDHHLRGSLLATLLQEGGSDAPLQRSG